MIQLTPEQAREVERAECPVRARDSRSREYVILPSDVYDRMKRLLEAEEVDPSFFECEEDIPEPS